MKLYVPHLGDELKLLEDWSFTLHRESRNDSLIDLFRLKNPHPYDFAPNTKYETWEKEHIDGPDGSTAWSGRRFYKKPVVIPAGTVLKIKRIYIRQGQNDFDSITFATKLPDRSGKLKPVRFWVKLNDANNINFEKVSE